MKIDIVAEGNYFSFYSIYIDYLIWSINIDFMKVLLKIFESKSHTDKK